MNSASHRPSPVRHLGRFLEIQNLGLNLPFALAFLWVAAGGLPHWRVIALVLVAFLAGRNAGHSFNRYSDRFFDGRTSRTQARPLVTDRSGAAFALGFAALNGGFVVLAASLLNPLAFLLSPVALLLLFGYSYTKRWTSLTTVFLGLVEAIAPAGVFIAVTGTLPWTALVAVGAMLFWGTAFEMIHSLGDIETDQRMGLFSLPARLGIGTTVRLLPVLHGVALALFLAFGLIENLGAPFLLAILAMVLVTGWTDLTVRRSPGAPRGPFRRHFLLGFLFFLGTTVAVFVPALR